MKFQRRNARFCVLASHASRAALAFAAIAPQAVFAQSADTSGPQGKLQDIIVTAQKQEQNLQKVPVAVTALTRDKIENLQVQNLSDLGGLAPNLVAITGISGSSPIFQLRGILGQNFGTGQDSGIALYIDGVYISRTTGVAADLADIDRVEILRGPQGTIYGRNSTGGAINYITSGPKGEFHVRQEVTVGNQGRIRSKTRVDLPKVGAFSASFSYLHDENSGAVRNSAAGLVWNFQQFTKGLLKGDRRSVSTLGAANSDAFGAAIRYAPDSIPLTVDYRFDHSDGRYSNVAQQVFVDTLSPSLGLTRPVPATFTRLDSVPMGSTTPESLKGYGHSLTAQWRPSEHLSLKSITGYRGFTDTFSADTAGGGLEYANFFPLTTVFYERQRAFSEELQLNYRSKLIDIISGLYYYRESIRDLASLIAFQFIPNRDLPSPDAPLTLGGSSSASDARSVNRSLAGFAQGTIHATRSLDLTAGIRWTKDIRQTQSDGFRQAPSFCGPGGVGPCVITPIPGFPRTTFTHFDWTANITYRPADGVTVYAKAGTGYLSGGIYNGRAFEPEELLQYEVGAKADLLDRRLRVNLAAYHSNYDNMQQATNNPNPPFLFQVFNVGKAHIDGVEVEVTALPVNNLTISASYGYNRFKFKEFNFPGVGDVTAIANPTYERPKDTVNFSAEYRFPEFADGIKPSVNFDLQYYSNKAPGLLPVADSVVSRFLSDNSMLKLNARATLAQLALGPAKGKISLWVRNLTDRRKLITALSLGPLVAGTFQDPRTYGVDLGVEF